MLGKYQRSCRKLVFSKNHGTFQAEFWFTLYCMSSCSSANISCTIVSAISALCIISRGWITALPWQVTTAARNYPSKPTFRSAVNTPVLKDNRLLISACRGTSAYTKSCCLHYWLLSLFTLLPLKIYFFV